MSKLEQFRSDLDELLLLVSDDQYVPSSEACPSRQVRHLSWIDMR